MCTIINEAAHYRTTSYYAIHTHLHGVGLYGNCTAHMHAHCGV